MATPNGTLIGALTERVDNQGKDIIDLRSNMNTGFNNVNAAINQLANETRTQMGHLTATISERDRTPWGILISAGVFFLGVVTAVGALAYQPIREATSEAKQSISDLEDNTVSRREQDWRSTRAIEDRSRVDTAIQTLRDDQVPRREHERVWLAYDQRLAEIQRQIDEIKQTTNSVYNQRDIILDLRERIDRLEVRRSRVSSP